jgi:hypothetical protein
MTFLSFLGFLSDVSFLGCLEDLRVLYSFVGGGCVIPAGS